MPEYYDALEQRDPAARDTALFARLPAAIKAALKGRLLNALIPRLS